MAVKDTSGFRAWFVKPSAITSALYGAESSPFQHKLFFVFFSKSKSNLWLRLEDNLDCWVLRVLSCRISAFRLSLRTLENNVSWFAEHKEYGKCRQNPWLLLTVCLMSWITVSNCVFSCCLFGLANAHELVIFLLVNLCRWWLEWCWLLDRRTILEFRISVEGDIASSSGSSSKIISGPSFDVSDEVALRFTSLGVPHFSKTVWVI